MFVVAEKSREEKLAKEIKKTFESLENIYKLRNYQNEGSSFIFLSLEEPQ